MNNSVTIFTDGSSRGNPGPGGWGAIVGYGGKIKELGGRENPTTNNKMELTAALRALEFIEDKAGKVSENNKLVEENAGGILKNGRPDLPPPQPFFKIPPALLAVHTDSSYLIQGITKWVKGWVRNDWMTSAKEPVSNQDIWQDLISVTEKLEAHAGIRWVHIEGHAGVPGNERCDEIATAMADGKKIELYDGPQEKYEINLAITSGNRIKNEVSIEKKERAKLKAHSYLSLVNGKLEKHATWAECERRVKGIKGAKFKKSISKFDEESIAKEWQK